MDKTWGKGPFYGIVGFGGIDKCCESEACASGVIDAAHIGVIGHLPMRGASLLFESSRG